MKKYIIRIILFPIALAYAAFVFFSGIISTLMIMIMFISLAHLIGFAINDLQGKEYEEETWITVSKNKYVNCILGISIPIWLMPYIVYLYIKNGEFYFPD